MKITFNEFGWRALEERAAEEGAGLDEMVSLALSYYESELSSGRVATDIPRVFGGKPVALIGASPGGFGTILSQNAWLPVLRTLGAELWSGGRLMVSRAANVFTNEGALADPKLREQLRQYLEGFAGFVAQNRLPAH